MNNILEVRGLEKSYGAFSLKNVSFEIPKGYIMGFIGPNGAGKTTTIKSILNMVNYQSGEIRIFGSDIKEEGLSLNQEVGVVMDSPLYVEEWTPEDVEKAIAPFYKHWDGKKYLELLKKFHIDKKKKVKELSRGMKVKLMVSTALSHGARLLILDEPTSGLDPAARDELCEVLIDFISTGDSSILFSTHITTDLEKIADYITFILEGKIIFTGTKDELLEKYVLVKGGRGEINSEQKRLVIGRRDYSTGFEGMVEAVNIPILPKSLTIDPITLEEIIVYINKEASGDE